MPQPLSGILVVDFTTLLPGPLATLMLAEAGAEVIKIEPPGGEEMRTFPPHLDGMSAAFAMLNRGKSGLSIDLKDPNQREELDALLRRADILVEQFRPGVMERLGLGYDAVRAVNPRIVYCSISGYGQHGPRAQEAGHDLNYIGATGLLALQPGPAQQPVVPPALVADIGGGAMPAMINILLALRQRDVTEQGCHIDVAMADAMFTFAWLGLATGFATGRYPAAGELPLMGGSPRYQLYPTGDDKLVACAALEQKFWLRFCKAVELPQPLIDDKLDGKATRVAIAAIIAAKPAEHWRELLAGADCCATIVVSLEEAMQDPHFAGRGLFSHEVVGSSGTVIPALPVPIDPLFRDGDRTQKSAPILSKNASSE